VTIGDLLAALRRFRLLALAIFVLVFGIGIGSLVVQASRYESDAVLTVTPQDKNVGYDSQQAVQLLLPPIIKRINSAAFEQSVRDRIGPRFRNDPTDISAGNEPGTSVINLTARSSTSAAALNAAQVATARLLQEPQSQKISLEMVSPAAAPTSVKAARAPRILGGTFLLGLILAVLAAAAAHRLRPPLPRAEKFRERFGYEVLGEIPAVPGRKGQTAAETFNASGSLELVEAFRSLEARVASRVAAGGVHDLQTAIAVTSWGDHDGKSTVATHLAWSLATQRRHVTLVDCDLRRPSAHTLLGVPLEPGVADMDEGRPVLSMCHETSMRSLDVIPAGIPKRHPAELLHERLPRFLAALRNRTVVVDTPPMFTAEATEIVGEADFVLLVADYRKRMPDELGDALAELELSGTPVLGVVLNRVTERDTRGREDYAYHAADQAQPASEAAAGDATPSKASSPRSREPRA
jgi:Mrp family chromosome partitioning ATPase